MNFKARFDPEVRIRLTDDLSGFVCTVRRCWFHTKSDEFAVEPRPAQPLGLIDGYVVPEPMRAQDRRSLRDL
jgi:hypothetical protein